jgi:hypothetical protein
LPANDPLGCREFVAHPFHHLIDHMQRTRSSPKTGRPTQTALCGAEIAEIGVSPALPCGEPQHRGDEPRLFSDVATLDQGPAQIVETYGLAVRTDRRNAVNATAVGPSQCTRVNRRLVNQHQLPGWRTVSGTLSAMIYAERACPPVQRYAPRWRRQRARDQERRHKPRQAAPGPRPPSAPSPTPARRLPDHRRRSAPAARMTRYLPWRLCLAPRTRLAPPAATVGSPSPPSPARARTRRREPAQPSTAPLALRAGGAVGQARPRTR